MIQNTHITHTTHTTHTQHTHTHTHTHLHTHTLTLTHIHIASCLVPVADMLNMAVAEDGNNVVCDTNEASTHFECSTTKPVAAGTQVISVH